MVQQFQRDGAAARQADVGGGNEFWRAIDVNFQRQMETGNLPAGGLGLLLVVGRNRKSHIRHFALDKFRSLQQRRQVVRHFLSPRTGQQRHQPAFVLAARELLHELCVQLLGPQFIKIRMAHVRGVAAPLSQPGFLERQFAEGVIDVSPHFLDPPRQPSPQLRQPVVEDRNAVCLGPGRDVPIEAGIVDEDHAVGPLLAEVAVGLGLQREKLGEFGQHRPDTHHRQLAHIVQQLAPSRLHARPAKAGTVQPRLAAGQFGNQIGTMQVAAGFTDGKKEFHAVSIRECSPLTP